MLRLNNNYTILLKREDPLLTILRLRASSPWSLDSLLARYIILDGLYAGAKTILDSASVGKKER